MTKTCAGCGVKLQFDDLNKQGYIPESKYNDSNYCQRCFKMTHYGINSVDELPHSNEDLIKKINNNPKFTLFLIDFLNINDEVINIFKEINTKKALLINKCEMLPKFINKNKIIDFLRQNYSIVDEILLKGENGSREYEIINDYINSKKLKELYLVGLSNVGKSTLINDLIQLNKSEIPKVTVNKRNNTTLDFIKLDLNQYILIDTPGFIIKNYVTIPIAKKIKSYIFQMKGSETLNLTDEYFITLENASNINYFTNYINEKTIKKNFKTNLNTITKIEIPENSDLVILGLGFIRFKNKTTIRTNIDMKYLSIRSSLFGRY